MPISTQLSTLASSVVSFIKAVCISINRHLVHEGIYDEYVERLTERAESLPVGSVHDSDTIVGPIIDESQRDEMLEYVNETIEAGATLVTGGSTVRLEGVDDSLVVAPTVLSDVTNDMSAACFEHFGPIAPVISFFDIDEAVELANDTEYGLSGSVHAGDVGAGKAIADRLDTGMVHVIDQSVNDEAHVSFGGTGASGVGGTTRRTSSRKSPRRSGSRCSTNSVSTRSNCRVE